MADSPLKKEPLPQLEQPGSLYFAVFFLALSALLLSQIGSETSWVKGTKFFAQPRFWPAIGLLGMTFFAALHCFRSVRLKRSENNVAELMLWLRSLEYAFWFMAYVLLVPRLGYLFSTLVFIYALTWRTGYREKNILVMAGVVATVVVVVFKGFLSVKIPGGQLYEWFPEAIRNFMILYL